MALVFIGLGSNLSNPVLQVKTALLSIDKLPKTKLLKQSNLYQTEPVGGVLQDDFINAVALLETDLSPMNLLRELQAIEKEHKRERKIKWGARTLDLDILLFGDKIIDLPDLKIPHPLMSERGFVLIPLSELSKNLMIPKVSKTIAELLTQLSETKIKSLKLNKF